MKHSAVIFDLDGTLLNTLTDLTDAVNYALGGCGLPLRRPDEVRAFLGDGYVKLIERATDGNKTAEAYPLFTDYYSRHLEDNTIPYDGVCDMLKSVVGSGAKTAIVSNKGDEAVRKLYDRFFCPLVTASFGVTDSMPKKPAPDMLYAAMERLGIASSEVVMVGDGEADIEMARAAGIDIVSVAWGYRTREFLAMHGATEIVDRVENLIDYL